VTGVDGKQNQLTVERPDGRELTYDPRRLQGVSVYREAQREFAEGDRVQFTAPSRELNVANRELGTVSQLIAKATSQFKPILVSEWSSKSTSIPT